MFKRRFTFFLVFTFLSNILYSQGKIDSIYSTLNKFPISTQFSIGIVGKDTVTYVGLKRTKHGISNVDIRDSVFEIGSITKVFTSIILGRYVLDSRLNLHDTIGQFVEISSENDVGNITLCELANHTSGLSRIPPNLNLWGNYQNPYKSYSSEDLFEFLKSSHRTLNSLSKEYVYSNLGMGLLGEILARIDSSTFEEVLQKNVLQPYGMHHTTSKRANVKNKIIKGLNVDGTEAHSWDFDALSGAGAILSTCSDMCRFIKNQLLSKNYLLDSIVMSPTHKISDSMQIGLGWHILDKGEQEYYWHNGGTAGYTSSLILDRKKHKGVIILTNVSAFHPESKIIDRLIMHLVN